MSTRREFIKTAAASGAGLWISGTGWSQAIPSAGGAKKRYVIVGTGGRQALYREAILGKYADTSELVGLCDTNIGRARLAQSKARAKSGKLIPIYEAQDFDRMIAETKPSAVIVTTVDSFHDQYIVRAMELGCDAVTEKPMTNHEDKCRRIFETIRKTGRKLRVTFNYRYSPPRTQMKDLLMSGIIGDILSVDFHWMLNTHHGADYFRRWHSQKKFSQGLQIHKATHHFDLINWWLSAVPATVFATGKREFYTPEMAKRFGLESHHERCHTCPEKAKCAFELDLAANPSLKELYLDQEQFDGYFRDRCVFRPDIDIEDTINALVTYDNNITLCYSVNAFNSWEGYLVSINGTKGRIEQKAEESVYLTADGSVPGALKAEGTYLRVYPLREPAYSIDVWTGEGGHGGGDDVMLDDIFGADPKPDKYLRNADQRAGAYGCLVGAAINRCFQTGAPVKIADLVPDIGYPDYPPMPSRTGPLPMPKKS